MPGTFCRGKRCRMETSSVSPNQCGKGFEINMKHFFIQLYRNFFGKECLTLASNISFCALLSLIPMLMIGVATAGYFLGGTQTVYSRLIASVVSFLPQGRAEILANLEQIVHNWNRLGLWGLGILLFISTLLFGAIESAFNKIFSSEKRRNFFHSRLLAIGLIVLLAILFFLPILSGVMDATLARFGFAFPLNKLFHGPFYRPLSTFIAFVLLVLAVPNQKVQLRYAVAGGSIFAIGVVLVRHFFFWYLHYAFAQYNVIFGSLAALVVLILWIYYLSLTLLTAALVVATLQHRAQNRSSNI